jgi:hypothetical protein
VTPTPRATRLTRAWLAGLALAAFAAGCAHAEAPPATRPYPAPLAETLLAGLRAHQAAVASASARVRATSWLGGERVRATVNMLIVRDGHLRFEAEVSLQGTVAALATDGSAFALYDVRRNELSRGPACPANVASLVRIPLAPADIAAVLLGDARLPAASPDAETRSPGIRAAARHPRPARPRGRRSPPFFRGQGDGRGPRDLVAVVRTGRDGALANRLRNSRPWPALASKLIRHAEQRRLTAAWRSSPGPNPPAPPARAATRPGLGRCARPAAASSASPPLTLGLIRSARILIPLRAARTPTPVPTPTAAWWRFAGAELAFRIVDASSAPAKRKRAA